MDLLGATHFSPDQPTAAEVAVPSAEPPLLQRLQALWTRPDGQGPAALQAAEALLQAAAADPDSTFDALYALLLHAERCGPAALACQATLALAWRLAAVDRTAEALALLQQQRQAGQPTAGSPGLHQAFQARLAGTLMQAQQPEEARTEWLALLAGAADAVPPAMRLQAKLGLCGACVQLGLLDEATGALVAAQAVAPELGPVAEQGACHLAAAQIAHAQGRLEDAAELLEEALACLQVDATLPAQGPQQLAAYALLSKCLAGLGRYAQAYACQRRFIDAFRLRAAWVARGQLAAAKARAAQGARIQLTRRERDCLSWSAAGKTAWETGRILALSEWTVVYHLEKAKRKFGLTRKQEVIARAISLGLIEDRPHASATAP